MLARSGPLPTSGDYAYELKWDGFRAVVSTEDTLRVRSRRGWDMTEHVTFLADMPVRAEREGALRTKCTRLFVLRLGGAIGAPGPRGAPTRCGHWFAPGTWL
jgi:hypothetical protein